MVPLACLYSTLTLALHQRFGIGFGAFTAPLRHLYASLTPGQGFRISFGSFTVLLGHLYTSFRTTIWEYEFWGLEGTFIAPLCWLYTNDLAWVLVRLRSLYGTFTPALHQRFGMGFGALTAPLRRLYAGFNIKDLGWVLGPLRHFYASFTSTSWDGFGAW